MEKRKLNSITYGAIVCALIGALIYVNKLVGGYIELYLFWILPLPVIIYTIKFSVKQSIVMCVAALLLSFILGNPTSLLYVFASEVAGIVYGYGVNKGKSSLFLIGSVVAVSLIVTIITTFLFAEVFGFMSMAEEITYFEGIFSDVVNNYVTDVTLAEKVKAMFDHNFLTSIYYIATILASVCEGLVVHLLSYIILRRLKMKLPPMKNPIEIVCPTWLKIYVFAAYSAYFASVLSNVHNYDNIIKPLYVVAQLVCYFFGYIIISSFLASKIKQKTTVILLTLITAVALMNIYVYAGIFDIFSNYRKNKIQEYKQQQQGQ